MCTRDIFCAKDARLTYIYIYIYIYILFFFSVLQYPSNKETFCVQKMHVSHIHDACHMRERGRSQVNEPRQTLEGTALPRIAKDNLVECETGLSVCERALPHTDVPKRGAAV